MCIFPARCPLWKQARSCTEHFKFKKIFDLSSFITKMKLLFFIDITLIDFFYIDIHNTDITF